MSTIESVGQLRDILSTTILDLRAGRIEISRARAIAGLSAEINNSIMAEVAAARVRLLNNDAVPEIGSLKLGDALRPLKGLAAPAPLLRGKLDG